jgi:hypothetical protein
MLVTFFLFILFIFWAKDLLFSLYCIKTFPQFIVSLLFSLLFYFKELLWTRTFLKNILNHNGKQYGNIKNKILITESSLISYVNNRILHEGFVVFINF